jgi:hypothetical protein
MPRYTLRLTFAYEGTQVKLISATKVEMIPPPGEAYVIHQGQNGYWVELRDAQERVLYQRVLHYPIRYEHEVVAEAGTGRLEWQKTPDAHGVFEVLVPTLPEAKTVVLFGSSPEAIHEPAGQFFSVDLTASSLGRQ